MASSSSIARLREQTMGSQLEEEAVTVNTRALIDKVLARYSGEWTTLRELIQNAADAQASRVTIRFETSPSATVPFPQSNNSSELLRHTILHHTLKTLLVSNDGEVFGDSDWSRLKRIAEGNPDETKIGAFGVGFYSVFADCETPFVSSGNQTMAFYWKKDSLFTRRGRSEESSNSTKQTTFMLDYRSSTTPVPSLLSICQFLATSLTFVGLTGIDLYLNDWHILKLTKKMAPGVNINLPRDVNPRTRDGLMKIVGVEYQNAQIDAQWMNVVGWDRTTTAATNKAIEQSQPDTSGSLRGWFSRLAGGINSTSVASKRAQREEEALQAAIVEDLAGFSNATVFLRLSTVSVQTSVSRSLAQELERATKKPPPKQTKIAILTSSYDEASASMSTMSGAGSKNASTIFASVLPTKNGKIFIGFPTAQTTGLLAHISAPSVIPTVERESIDLNARYVRDWNVEMLRVAGIACRVAFTGEMAELKARLERNVATSQRRKVTKEDITALMPAAVHVFKQYNYEESTPSAKVGQFIEEAFWTCNQKASIDILSTRGVLPSQQVRVATEDLSFVEGIPVVPEELMKQAENFITKLRDYGLLSDITTSDIKRELEAQALTERQVIELLKWAASKVGSQLMDARLVQTLFDGTIGTVDEEYVSTSTSPVIQLGEIQSFVNVAKIPADMPTPPNTIPFRLTKVLTIAQLSSLGWEELQIVPWLRWVVQTNGTSFGSGQTLTSTPAVASQVLPVVSKSWDGLSNGSRQTIHELLVPRTVIPTKQGMRTPPQAYFGSVKLFDDLPTITGLQGTKEKFLAYLGVRKTIELNVVFDRLMAKSLPDNKVEEGKWSHVDLIKYLVSVKDDIPQEDMIRLQKTPICPAEKQPGIDQSKLYCVSQLYEPDDQIKRLGLPVLQWPGLWRSSSNEGKFLQRLGLRSHPDVPTLVEIMCKAKPNSDLHLNALRYFVTNGIRFGYDRYPMNKLQSAFLPTEPLPGEKEGILAKPSDCFASPRVAALRFRVLREDLHAHYTLLGVSIHPSIELCAERLIRQPPLDTQQANLLFGYFAGRLNDLPPSGPLADRIGNAPIVPVYDKIGPGKRGNVRFATPRTVFIAGAGNTFDDIFDYVDFDQDANSFLLRVGSKHEPTTTELAHTAVREPARLLHVLGEDKYLNLLRRLAEGASLLKKDKALWAEMKRAAFLLGQQDSAPTAHGLDDKLAGDQDDHLIKTSHLVAASAMVIDDDFAASRIFQGHLICAPPEEVLETFYASLDTPYLSTLTENSLRTGDSLRDQSAADKLYKLIIERCRLFLSDIDVPIKHDVKWIEKNMSVEVVEFLHMTRRLRGYRMQHVEKQTAALRGSSRDGATLYITSRYDLFEVSRSMVNVLLKRPRQQHYLALETLLDSDLRRLKAKGYNVDRILRQKAAETRMADMEKQRREEEARKQAQSSQQHNTQLETALQAVSASAKQANGSAHGPGMQDFEALPPPQTPDKSTSMPGAFGDSPEQNPLSRGGKKMSSIFSQLGKQFGINANNHSREQEQQMERMLGSGSTDELPPPYQSAGPIGGKSITPGTEVVTSPKALQQNLASAISACRPHNESSVFSRPQTNSIKETPAYCDTRPGHDLVFVGDVGRGIRFFLPRGHSGPRAFLSAHKESLAAFDTVLLNCAVIFGLAPTTLNIFHDESGAAIAFNRAGSIFCNLRYFMQLHDDGMSTSNGQMEAMAFWWITLCHELAHNLVEDHSQQHSYYTESFAHHYFGRMMWWMSRNIMAGGGGAQGAIAGS